MYKPSTTASGKPSIPTKIGAPGKPQMEKPRVYGGGGGFGGQAAVTPKNPFKKPVVK